MSPNQANKRFSQVTARGDLRYGYIQRRLKSFGWGNIFNGSLPYASYDLAENRIPCLAASLGIASDAASAQTVNLARGGVYYMYAPEEPMDATLESTASSVDLASIAFPELRMQLYFGKPASPTTFNFVTHGTLDRTTGKMLIRWLRPEEDAKAQVVGQTAHMARYAEFTCSAAKRLF
jgi:hypothetical protein